MSTKEDILNAAMAVFAEHGFHAGTVRDICDQAGANVAAVNYHFHDKTSLYAEVLQHAYRNAGIGEPMPLLADEPDHPAKQLGAWIAWYVRRLLHSGGTDVGRLMAREMAEPTEALDYLAKGAVQPVFMELGRLVDAACGGSLDERALKLQCVAIVGQCLVFHTGRAMLERLDPPHFGYEDADEIASHITKWALRSFDTSNVDAET
ncbi:MAG: CerR family C-terminal domain-containing protein [Planctomycetes bacterium]|nr:CerR family C-terminal domain-containing protein [Planctomycetota bacterium]MCP4839697.1 CerR family C-terminal domain-containing protein [Planctomycetota bacterium]